MRGGGGSGSGNVKFNQFSKVHSLDAVKLINANM